MVENAVLRASELALLLGLSRGRVYQLIAARQLPAVRRGRAIRVPRAAFEKWLADQSEEALATLQGGDEG